MTSLSHLSFNNFSFVPCVFPKIYLFCKNAIAVLVGSLICFYLTTSFLFAQDIDLPINHDLYHYVDRMDIQGHADTFLYTYLKPYDRNFLASTFSRIDTQNLSPSLRGWHERMRILADDAYASGIEKKGIFHTFFKNGRDLYHYKSANLELYVNPLLDTGVGQDRHQYSTGETPLTLLNNSRGLRFRGTFFNRIGFFTEVYDNILRLPQYSFDRYVSSGVFPGEAFIKRFGDQNGIDFFSSRAYITFSPIKNMRIKFGKDRAFWGNGYQSLQLSDHATDYFMLGITTRIWKLEYQNLFTQMIDFIPNRNDTEGDLPRKYAVFHQLNFYPTNNISLGIFESIVYSPMLANGNRGFEWQYLNPIIFYRSAEQYIGSPDNGTIGLHGKWNILQRLQLYGQVFIDDYNFSRRNEGSGYWGNKIGYQVGLKYIDAFNVPSLDLQVESNRVRPYTYQHFNTAANYVHYGQMLGHTAGGNLEDINLVLRYHPLPAWNLHMVYTRLQKGLDDSDVNWGGDANKSSLVNRPPDRDFGNVIGQGSLSSVNMLYGRLSFQPWKADIFIELVGRYRTENDIRSVSLMGGLRYGIAPRQFKD